MAFVSLFLFECFVCFGLFPPGASVAEFRVCVRLVLLFMYFFFVLCFAAIKKCSTEFGRDGFDG